MPKKRSDGAAADQVLVFLVPHTLFWSRYIHVKHTLTHTLNDFSLSPMACLPRLLVMLGLWMTIGEYSLLPTALPLDSLPLETAPPESCLHMCLAIVSQRRRITADGPQGSRSWSTTWTALSVRALSPSPIVTSRIFLALNLLRVKSRYNLTIS
jgi:hypothetical protein